jgi:hypothetical protein
MNSLAIVSWHTSTNKNLEENFCNFLLALFAECVDTLVLDDSWFVVESMMDTLLSTLLQNGFDKRYVTYNTTIKYIYRDV